MQKTGFVPVFCIHTGNRTERGSGRSDYASPWRKASENRGFTRSEIAYASRWGQRKAKTPTAGRFCISLTAGGMFCEHTKQPRRGWRPSVRDGAHESCGPQICYNR